MSKLFLILLFSLSFFSSSTSTVTLEIRASADCALKPYWCLRQKIIEVDLFINDDLGTSDTVCGSSSSLNSTYTTHEENDGKRNSYLELISEIYHNCTDDGSVRKTEFYLTSFNGYKSVSNYEQISIENDTFASIVYNAGIMLNEGDVVKQIFL